MQLDAAFSGADPTAKLLSLETQLLNEHSTRTVVRVPRLVYI